MIHSEGDVKEKQMFCSPISLSLSLSLFSFSLTVLRLDRSHMPPAPCVEPTHARPRMPSSKSRCVKACARQYGDQLADENASRYVSAVYDAFGTGLPDPASLNKIIFLMEKPTPTPWSPKLVALKARRK